jgi:hypothetical protein
LDHPGEGVDQAGYFRGDDHHDVSPRSDHRPAVQLRSDGVEHQSLRPGEEVPIVVAHAAYRQGTVFLLHRDADQPCPLLDDQTVQPLGAGQARDEVGGDLLLVCGDLGTGAAVRLRRRGGQNVDRGREVTGDLPVLPGGERRLDARNPGEDLPLGLVPRGHDRLDRDTLDGAAFPELGRGGQLLVNGGAPVRDGEQQGTDVRGDGAGEIVQIHPVLVIAGQLAPDIADQHPGDVADMADQATCSLWHIHKKSPPIFRFTEVALP